MKPPGDFYRQKAWCKECRKQDERNRRKNPKLIARYRARYANDLEFRAKEIFDRCKKRSKADGLQFDLDLEWVLSRLQSGTCAVSGMRFDFSAGKQPRGPSVDRIRAGGGYTKDNCRMVLNAVNAALMDWGLDQFVDIAKAIAARH